MPHFPGIVSEWGKQVTGHFQQGETGAVLARLELKALAMLSTPDSLTVVAGELTVSHILAMFRLI